jgi:hypothetical protein
VLVVRCASGAGARSTFPCLRRTSRWPHMRSTMLLQGAAARHFKASTLGGWTWLRTYGRPRLSVALSLGGDMGTLCASAGLQCIGFGCQVAAASLSLVDTPALCKRSATEGIRLDQVRRAQRRSAPSPRGSREDCQVAVGRCARVSPSSFCAAQDACLRRGMTRARMQGDGWRSPRIRAGPRRHGPGLGLGRYHQPSRADQPDKSLTGDLP